MSSSLSKLVIFVSCSIDQSSGTSHNTIGVLGPALAKQPTIISAMPNVGPSHGEDTDGHELHVLPSGRLPDKEAQLGGGATPNVPDIGQQQNNINERDDPDKMSPDERSRLWRDLEAETGYSSYLD